MGRTEGSFVDGLDVGDLDGFNVGELDGTFVG